MPIYEYVCPECGNKFEKLVRSSDNKPPECPKCGNGNVKKVFSTFACSSKGGGSTSPHGPACSG